MGRGSREEPRPSFFARGNLPGMSRIVAVCVAIFALAARADMDPGKAAQIDKEREAAYADIAKQHGGKKSTEMDNDERKQVIEEQKAAQKDILDKNGTDEKEYAHYTARMNKDQ